MEKNPRTWAAVRAHFMGNDPKGDEILTKLVDDAECAELRYVLICWEGIGEHGDHYVAGAWATLDELVEDYGWGSGTPEYAIDLAAEPDAAVVGLALRIAAVEVRDTLDSRAIELEAGSLGDFLRIHHLPAAAEDADGGMAQDAIARRFREIGDDESAEIVERWSA